MHSHELLLALPELLACMSSAALPPQRIDEIGQHCFFQHDPRYCVCVLALWRCCACYPSDLTRSHSAVSHPSLSQTATADFHPLR